MVSVYSIFIFCIILKSIYLLSFFKKRILNYTDNSCKTEFRKRKFDEIDADVDNAVISLQRASAKTTAPSQSFKFPRSQAFDLDLSETNEKADYKPFTVNLGKNTILELKEFRGSWYVGLSKYSAATNEPKNRFNLPLEQLINLKKGCDAILTHISKKE